MSMLLDVSHLSVEYLTQFDSVAALNDVSFRLPSRGYTLGIVGESGSGKTTLGLSIMNLIESPGRISSNSSIRYSGTDILAMSDNQLRNYRWKEVSMVYQSAMNSFSPVKKVIDHIIEVMKEHHVPKNESRETALKLLGQMGIEPEFFESFAHQLSGGMRQRAVIAMAMALTPSILIADEPTSALDVVTQRQVLSLLRKEVIERQLSLIFITHEIALLRGLVQNVSVMYAGEIVETGPTEKVLHEPLHPYTESLLKTLITMDSDPGMISSSDSLQPDSGFVVRSQTYCRYVHRCKWAFDRCRKEKPVLREVQKERFVACHKYS